MSIYQYTQGCQATVVITVVDSYGHQTAPDNNLFPTFNLDYQTPNGPVNIFTGRLMAPLNSTNTMWYGVIDTMTLSVGSYVITSNWIQGGQQLSSQQRLDVLAFDGMVLFPIDPISRLRLRLKDNSPNPIDWNWTDQELSEYLQDALDNFNSAPPFSKFTWANLDLKFLSNIMTYAQALALNANAIQKSQDSIVFNDRNIMTDSYRQTQQYQSLASELFDRADAERLRIKRQFAYHFGYIVSSNSAFLPNIPLRAYGRFWSI